MEDYLSRLQEELRIVRASRDRYRSLVDSLPVGVALMDRSFRIVSANRAFACFVGRDVRDVAGLDLAMAFGVEKGDLQAVSMLPEGGSWGLSLRVPGQEGEKGASMSRSPRISTPRGSSRFSPWMRRSERNWRYSTRNFSGTCRSGHSGRRWMVI
ncbi:MAG: PAS domain-containing protein [Deltaproteobacteria bacterium]